MSDFDGYYGGDIVQYWRCKYARTIGRVCWAGMARPASMTRSGSVWSRAPRSRGFDPKWEEVDHFMDEHHTEYVNLD